MIVADALLAAGMGSVDALRSAAPQADCSRMRRMRCFRRQAPDFAAETASFFLNSSQGKALFTPASGAAHNFRRHLPAGLRMPVSADGRSVVIHRRKKTDVRSKSTNTVRGSHCVVRSPCPNGKKGDDELGLLRDIQQERFAAPWVSTYALEIRAQCHGGCVGTCFALTKKKIAVEGYAHHEPYIDCS